MPTWRDGKTGTISEGDPYAAWERQAHSLRHESRRSVCLLSTLSAESEPQCGDWAMFAQCSPSHVPVCVCLCVCVCVCQGVNSNHAQTVRFNIPTFLPLLQTISSMFCPAGGAALTGKWLRVCVCVCVCVICTFRGGSLCSVGLDASFGSGLLRPLCDVVSLPSAESEPLYFAG